MKKFKYVALLVAVCMVLSSGVLVQASEYDLGGRTVVIGYNHDLGERHFSEPEARAYLEEIEERFNANIEFGIYAPHSAGDFVEWLAPQIMAGDHEIDLMLIMNHMMYAASAEGLLHPLDDYLDQDYWQSLHPSARGLREIHQNPADGHLYSFHHGGGLSGYVIAWNKDLFEREGLPNPYELWQAGEWTWDAFYDIAVRATRDTTGDGEIDQWGFGVARNWSLEYAGNDLFRNFVFSNEGAAVKNVDGRVVFALDDPPAMEALEFIRDLYVEEQAAILPVHGNHGMPDPRSAFHAGDNAMVMTRLFRLGTMQQEMEDDYSIVPIPMGPRASEHKATATFNWQWSIPITVDDPEPLIALSNALWRSTEEHLEISWEEQRMNAMESFSMNIRDRESLETWEWLSENTMPSMGFHDFFIPDLYEAAGEILVEGNSVAATLDSIKPAAQAHLDELFN